MFCKQCGHILTDDANFCANCGNCLGVNIGVQKTAQRNSILNNAHVDYMERKQVFAEALKSFCSTPVFLVLSIVYTLFFVINFIMFVQTGCTINYNHGIAYLIVFTSFASLVPIALIAIGLWVIHVTAKNGHQISFTGIVMIKIGAVLKIIQLSIAVVLLFISMILLGQEVTYISRVSETYDFLGLFYIIMIVILLGIVLYIIFWSRICGLTGSALRTMRYGERISDVSTYAIVMCYVSGVLWLLMMILSVIGFSKLSSSGILLPVFSICCSAMVSFFAAVVLSGYKSTVIGASLYCYNNGIR